MVELIAHRVIDNGERIDLTVWRKKVIVFTTFLKVSKRSWGKDYQFL